MERTGDIAKITAYLTDIRDREPICAGPRSLSALLALPHTLLAVSNLARPGMINELDIVAAVAP